MNCEDSPIGQDVFIDTPNGVHMLWIDLPADRSVCSCILDWAHERYGRGRLERIHGAELDDVLMYRYHRERQRARAKRRG